MSRKTHPVAEAIVIIGGLRDEYLTKAERLAEVIEALKTITDEDTDLMISVDVSPAEPRSRRSVRAMAVDLMEEADRDWSTGEILAEYQRRGRPVHGVDPNNALRAALADAKKRELIYSTGVGRYRAAKWRNADTDEQVERIVSDPDRVERILNGGPDEWREDAPMVPSQ